MPKVPTTQDAKKYKPKDIGLKVRFSFSFVEMKWNHNEDKCSSNKHGYQLYECMCTLRRHKKIQLKRISRIGNTLACSYINFHFP